MKKTLFLLLLLPLLAQGQSGFTGKPRYSIITKRSGSLLGEIRVELFPAIAPLAVANFDSLVKMHFYDSTAFHRVVPGFVIQGGDPNSRSGPRSTWGQGNPSQKKVPAEFSAVSHQRGILSAARDTSPNSADSQFFICVAAATSLDGKYTAYGHVTSGMNIVDQIVSSPRDAADNPLQKIEMFVTYIGSNDTIPNAPVLTSPASGTQDVPDNQQLAWTAVNDAVMYTVELSEDPGFAVLSLKKDVPSNAFVLTGLKGLTTYYWRVTANNGGHVSAVSSAFSFMTTTGKPSLLSPQDNAVAVPLGADFNWSKVPGATSYRLQVAKSSSFFTPSMVFNQGGLTDTVQHVAGLASGTKYYWRVQSEHASAPGFYSSQRAFTTATVTGYEAPGLLHASLSQNYPNPAAGATVIRYSLDAASAVSLRLYDLAGREIEVLVNTSQAPGEYSVMLPSGALKSGVYFYVLSAGEVQVKRRMIVLN